MTVILVIILAVQVIILVILQKPIQIAAITPQTIPQMMKSIFNLKDKENIESLIHSTNYLLIHLLNGSFFL